VSFLDSLGGSLEVGKLADVIFGDRNSFDTPEREITRKEVAGRTKRREVVRAREILISLGVERYHLKVTEMATALQVKYDTASLWGRRGADRRAGDVDFACRMDEVDSSVASTPESRVEYTNV